MLQASGVGAFIQGILPFFIESKNPLLLICNNKNLDTLNTLNKTAGGAGNSEYSNTEIHIWNCKPFSLRELFFTPASLLKKINRCGIYFTPFFNIPAGIKIPVYTTIHDIIFPDMPELTGRAGLAARMFFYRRAFKRSRAIFTVSEFSASRIKHYAQKTIPMPDIYVVYSAVKSEFANARISYIKTNTILFTGNIKKHKGLALLIEALEIARKRGLTHRLVIVGSKENFRTKETLPDLDGAPSGMPEYAPDAAPFVFTGHISDAELCRLYAEAALLVQPSFYEGFGLPPLEAMFLGTAALVSDIPVFKEIYSGFPVHYFRAGDAPDLADKLCGLLLNNIPQNISLTDAQRERYTFAKTAAYILDITGGKTKTL
jgi:glycosyltransferase involved in cell wall biosynthesis